MNYSPEAFLALMETVEEQGGVHLTEACQPKPFSLRYPDDRVKKFHTTGCRQQARFVVPYGEGQTLIACAVDDNMGAWPRFKGALA